VTPHIRDHPRVPALLALPGEQPVHRRRPQGHDVRLVSAKLGIEAFANNVTDEAHGTQAIIDTGTQEFVFNPPRTYGLRMRVNF
jgi:hypothetical protein